MSFFLYLKNHLAIVVACCLAIFLGLGLLALFSIDVTYLVYVASILFWTLLIGFMLDYLPRRRFYSHLEQVRENNPDKLQLPKLLLTSDLKEAEALRVSLQSFADYYHEELERAQEQARDYREYLELWIHEVKNPLASASMTLANQPNPKITRELMRMESYLDQALYYARASSLENDYFIQDVHLGEVIERLLMKHAEELIEHRFKIERSNLDVSVQTDTKWLLFILEQLLNNAIKYRSENPTLHFTTVIYSDATDFTMTDNGIGISAKDLPRVFEKSFTGEHGRSFERSTGIGLYLCRRLAEKMGLSVSIQSVENQSTTVTIRFPHGSLTQM